MSIAAVLTDLDGTLAATAQANFAAYEQALAEAGVAIGSRDDFIVKAAGLHWATSSPLYWPRPVAARCLRRSLDARPKFMAAGFIKSRSIAPFWRS